MNINYNFKIENLNWGTFARLGNQIKLFSFSAYVSPSLPSPMAFDKFSQYQKCEKVDEYIKEMRKVKVTRD